MTQSVRATSCRPRIARHYLDGLPKILDDGAIFWLAAGLGKSEFQTAMTKLVSFRESPGDRGICFSWTKGQIFVSLSDGLSHARAPSG